MAIDTAVPAVNLHDRGGRSRTGRGGLALFSRHLRNLDIFPHVDRLFVLLRKSSMGLPVTAPSGNANGASDREESSCTLPSPGFRITVQGSYESRLL